MKIKTIFILSFLSLFFLCESAFADMNVALESNGSIATASSYGCYGGCRYASYVNDGDTDTYWCGTEYSGGWIEIEFNGAYTINQIVLRISYHTITYKVLLSVDGEEWTTVVSSTTSNNESQEDAIMTHAIPASEAMFVRIEISGSNAPSSHIFKACLYELEAWSFDNDSENHALGSVWAEAYPAFWYDQRNPFDHTLIIGEGLNSNTYRWDCFGLSYREPYGEVSDTRTDDIADLDTIAFLAEKSPCKWPRDPHYGGPGLITPANFRGIGTCHQLANRALYYTEKTVHDAGGYLLTSVFLNCGTYGNVSTAARYGYSLTECLESAPKWEGTEIRQRSSLNKERLLFEKYFSKEGDTLRADSTLDEQYADLESRHEAYLDELLVLLVQNKLGTDFPEEKIKELQQMRRTLYKSLSAEDSVDGINSKLNSRRKDFRKILSKKEYKSLFGIDSDEDIDLRPLFDFE